jgi:hypothetical protein
MNMKVRINIEKEISREILENIFVTALEGGSNYWFFIPDESEKAIRSAVPIETESSFSMALIKAVLDHDVSVKIYDVEDAYLDESLGEINTKTIQEGLQKLADSDDAQNLMDELMEVGDANTSDVCFQYIVMGEIVFG